MVPKNKIQMFVLANYLLMSFIVFASCNTAEPPIPPVNANLSLVQDEISCTEAWLKLKTENLQLPANLNLLQDDNIKKTITLSSKDTALYIDSLLPNKTYQFQLVTNNNDIKSNKVAVTTLDTTDHNFTWQTFTFGEHSSSTLYDVAIIDENDIWAVGEIFMNDSLGNPDPTIYNAIHWDGQSWELKRIQTLFRGNLITVPLEGIMTFSETDIWVVGSLPIHGDGTNWTMFDVRTTVDPNLSLSKVWGSSTNNIYFVGNNGNIAHYNGSRWTKIISRVDTDLEDISGTSDGKEIWTCGWSNSTGRVSLLKIKNTYVESLWDNQTNTTLNIYRGTLLNSLYANGNSEFVLVGGQVLRHSLFYKNQVMLEWVKTYNGSKVLELGNYAYRIKGSNKNNIFAAGDAAMIWHFNGATWYKYLELYGLDDRLYGLAVTDNIIVAVGKRYAPGTLGGGLLIIGRR